MNRVYSSRELCQLSGCSYRQLNYWDTIGVLRPAVAPARGSGSQRRYSEAQVRTARLCAALFALGARAEVITEVVAQLEGLPASLWHGQLVAHRDGCAQLDGPVTGAAWVVDLGSCLEPDTILASAP